MPETCSEQGCENKAISRGLCRKHYDWVRKHLGMERSDAPQGRPPKVHEPLLGDWEEQPARTKGEVFALTLKQMYAALNDPQTPRDVKAVIWRLSCKWEIDPEDAGEKDELDELKGKVLGLVRDGSV